MMALSMTTEDMKLLLKDIIDKKQFSVLDDSTKKLKGILLDYRLSRRSINTLIAVMQTDYFKVFAELKPELRDKSELQKLKLYVLEEYPFEESYLTQYIQCWAFALSGGETQLVEPEEDLELIPDDEETFDAVMSKAKNGDVESQRALGQMYEEGTGVEIDYEAAAEWYREAAESMDTIAQLRLGILYEYGRGVLKSYKNAAQWYKRAANKMNTEARYRLGRLYYFGLGIDRNFGDAFSNFYYAADENHIEALYCAGICLCNGTGVRQDYEEAIRYIKKSAELGYRPAQEVLIKMYENGRGVNPNPQKAEHWRSQAEANTGIIYEYLNMPQMEG